MNCFSFLKIKPENVLMCVDEEHVRALAYQAAEWHKTGTKPVGSAGKMIDCYRIEVFSLRISIQFSGNDTHCE